MRVTGTLSLLPFGNTCYTVITLRRRNRIISKASINETIYALQICKGLFSTILTGVNISKPIKIFS